MRENRLFAKNEAVPLPEAESVKRIADAPALRPATKADVAKIAAVDKRYRDARSIAMDVSKTLKISALGRERASRGKLLVSRGKMRMEMDSPDRSLLVVDGATAWLVNYPSDEFKGAALQVVKANVGSKKARSQAIIGLLAGGGLLKHFTVVGFDESSATYFLQPQKQLVEFTRAQARLSADGKDLAQLSYWDELGNETRMDLSNLRLNVEAPASTFKYAPPADADVTVF